MTPTRRRLLIIVLYTLLLLLGLEGFWGVVLARQQAQRGVWFPGDPLPPPSGATTPLGTTVELTQYRTDAALDAALDEAAAMGLGWLRQPLPWDAVEPEPGRFMWEPWDRAIGAAHARGFRVVLVLHRTPAWARQPTERGNPLAPPADTGDFVRFARAAAARYGDRVYGWQVWDEPNLMPNWGTEVILDPKEYARFLEAVTPAIREGDPDAVVATAGLAPTSEPGGFNMSEVRFLQGLYEASAEPYFDAVALKPYGFGGEAEERVYEESRLNFDRVVLSREVMVRHGDAGTPIWFVEGGWATLPPDWPGDPAPWGSDGPDIQSFRLRAAIKRAALEWPWVQLIALQPLQPDVPRTDPRWGLALLDPDGTRTALGETTAQMGNDFFGGPLGAAAEAAWVSQGLPDLRRYDYALALVVVALVALAARLAWHGLALPWTAWGDAFRRQPEAAQVAALVLVALAFYVTEGRMLALLLYAALGVLIAWRFDLGLAAVTAAIPFYLQVKRFPPLQFSMVELLVLLCALVWALKQLPPNQKSQIKNPKLEAFFPRDGLDWAVALFALWAAASVFWAQDFGIAAREFRVVVAESALFFWLVRRAGLDGAARLRLVDALVASATLVALIGLYQWFFTGDIITAEGVRRVRGVYGSPNNLALLLERVVPLVVAVALLAPASRRRWLYALAGLPLGLCLFLTFSRGAWLLGIPSALAWLAWWGGPRARRGALALGGVALLVLIPFAATERIASTTDLAGGTWFIRLRLWQATLAMLRDFPLLGVGLDNFLYVYDTYRLPDAWREPDLSHPHQIVLHFWVALGLPGVLFLLWQQGAFWRRWLRVARRATRPTLARALLVGGGASMVAALAHGLIDNSFFLVDLAFIWMLTLALVGDFDPKRQSPSPAVPAAARTLASPPHHP